MNQRVAGLDAIAEHSRQHRRVAAQAMHSCKICGKDSPFFDRLDFNRVCGSATDYFNGAAGVDVYYRKCASCGFIFTDFFDSFTPELWRDHIYNPDYYESIDPEYKLIRPAHDSNELDCLLRSPSRRWIGLDYGGGNGLMSDLLRHKGYVFDCYDPFGANTVQAENIGRYNFCSSFEVLEHTVAPLDLMTDILRLCSPDRLGILVGTVTQNDSIRPGKLGDWWYAAPRNGHVSLYSRKSLELLALRFGLSHFSLSDSTHFLYRGYSAAEARRMLLLGKLRSRLRRIQKRLRH